MGSPSRDKILSAARELFLQKGVDGVKMQAIADKAGVNKGLLHYYFKEKHLLFREVFEGDVFIVAADIRAILKREIALKDKIPLMVDRLLEQLAQNPRLPVYVLFEIDKMPALIDWHPLRERLFENLSLIDKAMRAEGIEGDASQAFNFWLNMVSLCFFPFMIKPALTRIVGEFNIPVEQIMKARKKQIIQLLTANLKS